MKYLLILPVIFILNASCRNEKCWGPPIYLEYKGDTSKRVSFNVHLYEKGTNFSKLVRVEPDSIRFKYTDNQGNYEMYADHQILNDDYDYLIEVPSLAKTYKIADITYDGKKKVKNGNILSQESDIACAHNIHYKLNDETITVEGGNYYKHGGYSYKKAIVTIDAR